MNGSSEALKPSVLAERWAVRTETILHWIRSGQLRAMNVGTRFRPRYRILKSDAQAFFESRSNQSSQQVSQ